MTPPKVALMRVGANDDARLMGVLDTDLFGETRQPIMLNLIPIPGAELYYDDHFLSPEEATFGLERSAFVDLEHHSGSVLGAAIGKGVRTDQQLPHQSRSRSRQGRDRKKVKID